MSRTIDGSGIDRVLQNAVQGGAVPHVAAIAADADGIFYEGGAGARIVGESDDPVTTATQFRIMSMTKMVATTAALRFSGFSRNDPRVHSLNAPIDGPHHTW